MKLFFSEVEFQMTDSGLSINSKGLLTISECNIAAADLVARLSEKEAKGVAEALLEHFGAEAFEDVSQSVIEQYHVDE